MSSQIYADSDSDGELPPLPIVLTPRERAESDLRFRRLLAEGPHPPPPSVVVPPSSLLLLPPPPPPPPSKTSNVEQRRRAPLLEAKMVAWLDSQSAWTRQRHRIGGLIQDFIYDRATSSTVQLIDIVEQMHRLVRAAEHSASASEEPTSAAATGPSNQMSDESDEDIVSPVKVARLKKPRSTHARRTRARDASASTKHLGSKDSDSDTNASTSMKRDRKASATGTRTPPQPNGAS